MDTDNLLIAKALQYWANHIETGNISLSIQDAIRSKQLDLIKLLDIEQQKFVVRLRELAIKELRRK